MTDVLPSHYKRYRVPVEIIASPVLWLSSVSAEPARCGGPFCRTLDSGVPFQINEELEMHSWRFRTRLQVPLFYSLRKTDKPVAFHVAWICRSLL